MENCLELILEDVIRIEIFRQANINFSVPFNAPAVTEVACSVPAGTSPVLSINLDETVTSDVVMEPAPKLQTTEKREAAGLVRSHVIEASVIGGFQTAQAAADALIYNDIVAVVTTYDGSSYAVIPFPNTSVLTVTDNRQQTHTMTVAYAAQSFSGLAKVTSWSESSDSSSSSD